MISEDLEFLISQYVDGTIAPADRAALEAQLAANEEARLLVHEYQKLDTLVRSSVPELPKVDLDALGVRINDAIDAQEAAARQRFRIGRRLGAGLAIAASAMLAVGVWFGTQGHRDNGGGGGGRPAVAGKPAVVEIAVLQPEELVAAGPVVQQIRIGPPPAAGGRHPSRVVSEAVVTRPQALFIAKAEGPAQDTFRTPY